MPISARSVSSLTAIALLSAAASAQQVLTPEEEVIAMLREWRAQRAAAGMFPIRPPDAITGVDPSTRIRVGEKVQHMALISGSQPAYPEEARANGIEGVVTLEAVIGEDGRVKIVSAISGDPLLVPAAIEAVRGWTYRSTLLNGVPVEVETSIEVSFTLRNQEMDGSVLKAPVPRKKR